jgi:hypothetical protein
MAEDKAIKAKKVFNHIVSSLNNLGCIPYQTFFKIFDVKVSPVLLYGCEILGTGNISCTEDIH